ncbi:TlpA disulfide reductase family protein [Legionella nagasakiensis]|uniref:TlpA disulfide reductase family protein n=1 Tax=Legionella nagasakiensis TaxID=535290 RepID=UPI0010544037|nr:TlpA disulfide reductase family protein [Legionella nagasakiensis]
MLLRKLFFAALSSLLFAGSAKADVVLQDIHGQNIPFSSLNGKWVFINYWASWCQPCVDEIPELNRFYEKNKTGNVVIFGVNYDALPIQQQKMLVKQFDIRYPNLKRDPSSLLNLGDINGVPVTFVFNPQGELSKKLYGSQTVRSLSKVMASG